MATTTESLKPDDPVRVVEHDDSTRQTAPRGRGAAGNDTSREALGRLVRETWVAAVRELIPDPKPSWVAPWGELDGFQREVDMRIGEAVAAAERERQRASRSACCHQGDLDCNDFAATQVEERWWRDG